MGPSGIHGLQFSSSVKERCLQKKVGLIVKLNFLPFLTQNRLVYYLKPSRLNLLWKFYPFIHLNDHAQKLQSRSINLDSQTLLLQFLKLKSNPQQQSNQQLKYLNHFFHFLLFLTFSQVQQQVFWYQIQHVQQLCEQLSFS